ncbi:MerR family transcriptional regulator [Plantibacter sp. Mn2098]|uniref:MerR family transcriptional regulator n=1 Tax=Plantibacter sp. Mn2098 TaxID=3395266 RepID=UPI003BC661D9
MVMQIGEFAQVSGLTVKALRHYDERGLLRPAHVDPQTRYRSYAASQLRNAVLVRALRDAGVPIDDLTDVTLDVETATALLDTRRTRRIAERAREDAAETEAHNVLDAIGHPVPIEVQEAAEQHWVGVVMTAPAADDDRLTDDDANTSFGELWTALDAQGNRPDGMFWTTVRTGGAADVVELLLCWPIPERLPHDWTLPGHRIEAGTHPVRREITASWSFADGPQTDDAAHPAVVGLLEAIEERELDVDLSQLRQRGIAGPDGVPTGVELVYTLRDERRTA